MIDFVAATAWAEPLAWALWYSLWQGAILSAIFGLLLFCIPSDHARLRYRLGLAALGILSCLPPLTFISLWLSEATHLLPSIEKALLAKSADAHWNGDGPLISSGLRGEVEARLTEVLNYDWRTNISWIGLVVLLYASGILILTGKLIVQLLYIQRLRATAQESRSLERTANSLAHHVDIPRRVQFAISHRIDTVMVLGWRKPLILVPVKAIRHLTPKQLGNILLHELTHVKRNDYLINFLQCIIETLLFYHPATWWISHVVRREREHCCDDVSVIICGDCHGYSEALVLLEKCRARARQGLALAGISGNLTARIQRLFGISASPRDDAISLLTVMLTTAVLITALAFAFNQEPSSGFFHRLPSDTATLQQLGNRPAVSQSRFNLTTEELRQITPFEIFRPSKLPLGYEIVSQKIISKPHGALVSVLYHPTESNPKHTSGFSFSQLPLEASQALGPVGASAHIEHIPIGTRWGEFVVGAWLDIDQVFHWNASVDLSTLRWQQESFLFEIASASLDKQAMVDLAKSIVPLAAID